MTRYTNTGFVYLVDYKVSTVLDTLVANDEFQIELHGNPNSPDFIPYEDLTEDIVLTWVKNCLGESQVISIEQEQKNTIETMVSTIENPSMEGVPW